MLTTSFISAGFAVPYLSCRRVLASQAGAGCGLTHHSIGPAREAAQSGEFKRWVS